MKYHGLILLALSGLSTELLAQNALPPAPPSGQAEEIVVEPRQLPGSGAPASADQNPNIDAELQQFRNEMRSFQALREEVARAAKTVDQDADRSASQRHQELLNLLTKLTQKIEARKAAQSQPPAPPTLPIPPMIEEDDADLQMPESKPVPTFDFPTSENDLDEAGQPKEVIDAADAFALGKVLFRNGDFVGAEKAFRKATVVPENEMTLKYMLATCLRRQSQWKPAVEHYKVVAESNQDPVLRDLAKWQIENIRWQLQSEQQLEQMRKQREKASEPKKKTAANATRSKKKG